LTPPTLAHRRAGVNVGARTAPSLMCGRMAMPWPPVGARLKLEPWPIRSLPTRSPGAA
jgi:hypothetical protein